MTAASKWKSWFVTSIFLMSIFVVIFLPKFGVIDFSSATLVVITLACLPLPVRYRIPAQVWVLGFTAILFLTSFFGTANGLIQYGDTDGYFLIKAVKNVGTVFCLIEVFKRIDVSLNFFLKGIFFIFFIHVLAVYAEFVFPSLRAVLKAFLLAEAGNEIDSPYRSFGLANSFDVAGIYVVFFYIVTLYFLGSQRNPLRKIILWSLVFIQLMATLLTARVALANYAIVTMIYIFFTRKLRNSLPILMLIAGFALLVGLIFQVMIENNDFFKIALSRSFDFQASASDQSDILRQGLQMPDSFSSFFLGTGFAPYTDQGGKGDFGYGHYLWGVGLFGCLNIVVFYGFIGFRFFWRDLFQNPMTVRTVLLLWIAVTFIACFKGPYLFARGQFEIIFATWLMLERQVSNSKI